MKDNIHDVSLLHFSSRIENLIEIGIEKKYLRKECKNWLKNELNDLIGDLLASKSNVDIFNEDIDLDINLSEITGQDYHE